jgi:hypothetical protein
MLVSYHNATSCHNPEDIDLDLHSCENLKSRSLLFILLVSVSAVVHYKFWMHCRGAELLRHSEGSEGGSDGPCRDVLLLALLTCGSFVFNVNDT